MPVAAPERAAAGIRVTVATTASAIATVRGPWNELQRDVPATDPQLFSELLEVETGVLRPHVVLVERAGEPEALVVAKIRSLRLPTERGPAAAFAPRIRALVVVDRGIVGRVSADTASRLVRELLVPLEDGDADVCVLRHLPVSSPLHAAIESTVPRSRRGAARWPVRRWTRTLPAEYDAFLRALSKSMRRTLRQPGKRLDERSGARVEYRLHEAPEELGAFLRDAETVARVTYQRRRGVGFENDEQTRHVAKHAASHGWFRGWLLCLDGQPIAFEQGMVYGSTFHWLTGGFDPAFAEHRPGLCLIARVLEDVCTDPTVTALDFGLGDAAYKERLGCTANLEADVFLYGPRLRQRGINLVSSALVVAARPLRRLHER